jgi:hypothetical protein
MKRKKLTSFSQFAIVLVLIVAILFLLNENARYKQFYEKLLLQNDSLSAVIIQMNQNKSVADGGK